MFVDKNGNHEITHFNQLDEDLLTCFKPKKSLNEVLRLMAHGMVKFITGEKKTSLKGW